MEFDPDIKVTFESVRLLQDGHRDEQRVGVELYTAAGMLRRSALRILRHSGQPDETDNELLFRLTLANDFKVESQEGGGLHVTIYKNIYWLRVFQVLDTADKFSQHIDVMAKLIAAKIGGGEGINLKVIYKILGEVMVNSGGFMQIKKLDPRRIVAGILWYRDGMGSLAEVAKPRAEEGPSPSDLKQVIEEELSEPDQSGESDEMDETVGIR